MFDSIKSIHFIKKFRKTRFFSRLRQYLPMKELTYLEDFDFIEEQNPEPVKIDWPDNIKKPYIGIVKDYGIYPRWTKYIHLLEQNGFPYDIFHLRNSDWMIQAKKFDVIVNYPSNEPFILEDLRRKYMFIEKHMVKFCYPSTDHIFLYEDKQLEAFLADYHGFPFVKTHIFFDKEDALQSIKTMDFPLVSKIDSSSGSMGIELVPDIKTGRRIIEQSFSSVGRKTHLVYTRQKNHVYLQEYVPNDGYDLRVIIIGNHGFGYFRRVPNGDFRASGMNLIEMRALPFEAIWIAYEMNKILKSPQLVVDMLKGDDGNYFVIEYSPFCQSESAADLEVDGEAGVYIINEKDRSIHFEKGRYWVHELALREYLLKDYLPAVLSEHHEKKDESGYGIGT